MLLAVSGEAVVALERVVRTCAGSHVELHLGGVELADLIDRSCHLRRWLWSRYAGSVEVVPHLEIVLLYDLDQGVCVG